MNENSIDKPLTGKRTFVGDYSPLVKKISTLPRRTVEQRLELKNQIAKIREGIHKEREILSRTRTAIEKALITNPQIPDHELKRKVDLNQFPLEVQKAIRSTIDDFRVDRRRIDEVKSLLRKKAGGDKDKSQSKRLRMGKHLYRMLTNKNSEAGCEVKDSPYGVWMVVDADKDFNSLDDKVKECLGYYQVFQIISEGDKKWNFPLIVTKRYGSKVTIKHEEAHGGHSQIKTGLRVAGKKYYERYWGKREGNIHTFFLPRLYADLSKLVAKFKIFDRYSASLRNKAVKHFIKEAADLILSCQGKAKNEALAELYNPAGNLSNQLYYLKVEKKSPSASNVNAEIPIKNFGEDKKKEKEWVEKIAPYDYLTESGIQRVKGHWLFGKIAQEVRAEYNRSLDIAVTPLITLVSFWNETGIDTEKLRRRFVYGQLIPEPLHKWSGYLRREFDLETKIVAEIKVHQRKIWQKSYELSELAKDYANIGFPEEAKSAEKVAMAIEGDTNAPLQKVNEEIAAGQGEVNLQVFQNAVHETDGILKKHKAKLTKIEEVRSKLEADIQGKMDNTVIVKAAAQLQRDEYSIRETNTKAESLWQEQLALTDNLSAKLGVPIFAGVLALETQGMIPATIKVKADNPWEKEERTFILTGEKIRDAIQDIHDTRAALNQIGRLTVSNTELRQKITVPRKDLGEIIDAWFPSVFRRYQALSAPLDNQTQAQIEEEQNALREVQSACNQEFAEVARILAKYKTSSDNG